MANEENLTPFPPGVSGNPKGRPKGSYSLTSILRKILERKIDFNDPITKKKITQTVGDVIMLQLVAHAVKGDIPAAREVLDRIEGKTAQTKVNIVQGDQVFNTMNITAEDGEKLDAAIIDIIGRKVPEEPSNMEPELPAD